MRARSHEVGEGGERDELAGREEISEMRQPIQRCLEIACIIGKYYLWLPLWICLLGYFFMIISRGKIDSSSVTICNDCHQFGIHPPSNVS